MDKKIDTELPEAMPPNWWARLDERTNNILTMLSQLNTNQERLAKHQEEANGYIWSNMKALSETSDTVARHGTWISIFKGILYTVLAAILGGVITLLCGVWTL